MKIQRFAQKGIVFNEKREILLIKYQSAKYLSEKLVGKHALPGGKIGFGETPDESLIKEVAEETGVECVPGAPIYCWNWEYTKDKDEIQINAVARVCKYKSGNPNHYRKEKETTLGECVWVRMDKLPSLDMVEDEIPAVELFCENYDFYIGLADKKRTWVLVGEG